MPTTRGKIYQNNRNATYQQGMAGDTPCRVCGFSAPKGTPNKSKLRMYYLMRQVNWFRGDDELVDALCPKDYAIKENRLPNAL